MFGMQPGDQFVVCRPTVPATSSIQNDTPTFLANAMHAMNEVVSRRLRVAEPEVPYDYQGSRDQQCHHGGHGNDNGSS